MIDYSKGRYLVKDDTGRVIGRIDGDEFVRSGMELPYHVDGDELYSHNGDFVGDIEDGKVFAPAGEALFHIVAE